MSLNARITIHLGDSIFKLGALSYLSHSLLLVTLPCRVFLESVVATEKCCHVGMNGRGGPSRPLHCTSKQWLCITSGGGGVGNSSVFHVLCHGRFIWHIMYNNGSYTESRFNSHFKWKIRHFKLFVETINTPAETTKYFCMLSETMGLHHDRNVYL